MMEMTTYADAPDGDAVAVAMPMLAMMADV